MSAKLTNLLSRRAKVWAQAQDIRERLERDGYEPTTEDNETFNRALDEVTTIDRLIETEERAAAMDAASASAPAPEAPEARTDAPVDDEASYREAFLNATLRRTQAWDPSTRDQRQLVAQRMQEVRAAQASGTNSLGGYTIPTELQARMVEVIKAFGGILGVANVMTTGDGHPIDWVTNDDTANKGRLIGENTAVTNTEVDFGTNAIGAYTFSSDLILAPWTLLQDSVFDLEAFFARKCGERIGRAVADYLATGTGSSQPQGLMTGAGVGFTGAISATAAITYDDLIELQHSVDPAYRDAGRTRFVMNDASLKLVRKLKDSQNRPLWEPSVKAGTPSTLLGEPLTIDQGVASPAPNAVSIGYGDTESAFLVRAVAGGQLVVLRERYADNLQNGYFAFQRYDSVIDESGAFKTFKHGAAS